MAKASLHERYLEMAGLLALARQHVETLDEILNATLACVGVEIDSDAGAAVMDAVMRHNNVDQMLKRLEEVY